jgi:small conductance mechanosensitive channel
VKPLKLAGAGTIVSATVTLGYGVDHGRAEELLCRAAEAAGLSEPFVHILNLDDVSVEYRTAGLLTEVKHLLSARSQLRAAILDTLHAAGIEIMSPAIIDQRRVEPGARYLPPPRATAPEPRPNGAESAETVAFDKAEQASEVETLRIEIEQLDKKINASEKGSAREALTARRDRLKERLVAAEKEPQG